MTFTWVSVYMNISAHVKTLTHPTTYWDHISLPKKLVYKKFPKTSALGFKCWIQIPAAQKKKGSSLSNFGLN